jgi:hypothetical protein
MEAVWFSETSVKLYLTVWRHIRDQSTALRTSASTSVFRVLLIYTAQIIAVDEPTFYELEPKLCVTMVIVVLHHEEKYEKVWRNFRRVLKTLQILILFSRLWDRCGRKQRVGGSCRKAAKPAISELNRLLYKQNTATQLMEIFTDLWYAALQLLCFWTLPIVLFLFKTQRFGDWILSPSSSRTWNESPSHCVKKNRTMDNNVQKHNNCINIPPSQTFIAYTLPCFQLFSL